MNQDFPVDYALLRAAIIARCTRMFEEFRRNGRLTVYCGTPPDLLLLHIGVFLCQLQTRRRKLHQGWQPDYQ